MIPAIRSRMTKNLAQELGFDRCGIAAAQPVARQGYLRTWLDAGRAGSMQYLHRYFDQRVDPQVLLPGAQSVIVTALLYHAAPPHDDRQSENSRVDTEDPRGRVAMYAWGDDYHKVIKKKLFALVDRLRAEVDEPFDAKVCVDTAPILEREFAAAAGVGWIGKNTLVLDEVLGSYFFLGLVVTTLSLAPDEPATDHCGTCRACLDACPTDAFPAAYEMDATRCISYLTIEHRGDIPESLQSKMGDWVFGCDICQQVCPYNRKAPTTQEPRFAVREPGPTPRLHDLLKWTDEQYKDGLRGSAIKRATIDMLRRNARIALANATPGGV